MIYHVEQIKTILETQFPEIDVNYRVRSFTEKNADKFIIFNIGNQNQQTRATDLIIINTEIIVNFYIRTDLIITPEITDWSVIFPEINQLEAVMEENNYLSTGWHDLGDIENAGFTCINFNFNISEVITNE